MTLNITIEIKEISTKEDLKQRTQALVDAFAVINKQLNDANPHPNAWVNEFKGGDRRAVSTPERTQGVDLLQYDIMLSADHLPDVKHTFLTGATVNARAITLKWRYLMVEIVKEVMQVTGIRTAQELRQAIPPVRAADGVKTDAGFKFEPQLGLSLLQMDASQCLKVIVAAAKKYKIRVEISLRWREKRGATYPGKSAYLLIDPNP